jgi:4-diphosphocytidyl-2-C-methyl-D-erythritol kinase
VTRVPATAKLNLALVVGPRRDDGKHEVATVLQRIAIADRITLRPSETLRIDGFAEDTLVTSALELLADTAGVPPRWAVRIDKRLPVAAGVGGGSSDAATALRLANETLEAPLPDDALHAIAAQIGADVPFFLRSGPHLGTGDGTQLERLDVPQDYWVVLVVPHHVRKRSTAEAYQAFDERGGADGYQARRSELAETLASVRRTRDLGSLPANDLATSALADEMRALGAFRADVTGAGPAVYGLFLRRVDAAASRRKLASVGRAWLTIPAWYG